DVHAVTKPPRRDSKHATKLTTTEHSERAARQNRLTHNSDPSSTSLVCLSTCLRSCSRNSGRELLKIRTAKRPAFFAPASPIANVATGTPPGICTIERSESSP